MTRLLFLLCSFWMTTGSLTATHPIRTLRLLQTDGSTVSVPLSDLSSLSAGKEDICPAHFSQSRRTSRAMMATSPDGLGEFGTPSRGVLPSLGAPIIPIVMVEFSDVAFQASTTPARIDSLFDADDHALSPRAKGSVRDYYRAQSYGRFAPHFKVVGKVRVSRPRAYYGANSAASKNINIGELYREAIDLAQKGGADFSAFVVGGRVPLTVLLHAGPGEHDSFEAGNEDYPWAHFSENTLVSGGLRFDSYFVGCELMQSYERDPDTKQPRRDASGHPIVAGAELEGIGVFCHEMGHALGLPDFYSTREAQQTPDFHDIMDYAQYGNDGYWPLGYSAYERNYMGWLQLHELTDAGPYRLAALHDTVFDAPQAYLIRNAADSKEYYILENRRPSTWFASVLGQGMLVYHLHYDVNAWSANVVNTNPAHLRCVVVPADNVWQNRKTEAVDVADLQGKFQGDFFPGTKGVTELSEAGAPAMTWYAGGAARPIYDIAEEGMGGITFSFLQPHTTGLSAPTIATTDDAHVYSLDGRLVKWGNAPAGIYLQHGKKIIVR